MKQKMGFERCPSCKWCNIWVQFSFYNAVSICNLCLNIIYALDILYLKHSSQFHFFWTKLRRVMGTFWKCLPTRKIHAHGRVYHNCCNPSSMTVKITKKYKGFSSSCACVTSQKSHDEIYHPEIDILNNPKQNMPLRYGENNFPLHFRNNNRNQYSQSNSESHTAVQFINVLSKGYCRKKVRKFLENHAFGFILCSLFHWCW